ncbi:hypothetical protein TVAG_069870 [Trichomonas vaginalis G3]|uniref:Uncharacterized protein n=1 Tax=Trichomonas vaginalis (strain ATCC PRA-98 / G3) TaxID=412133 RepID=A2ESM8_TRIV3|nr:hypothetical protein TVAGG3_0220710 [Trichomonas vaginalis G3]EAY04337.1 hypothetical protein TVAG_069870 [Trichomonas vaginalis G3]KAI5551911.1 hypothetical protein TVAGG3_0220710 [Trichomonas vaginalis G3]|eukprot:XP_001316560.1 hypothetical protein [Trichomonas vaginalis G3]
MSNAAGFRGSSRVGLSKIRPLTAKARPPSSKNHDIELPNGNYLNEHKANQLWADIESVKPREYTVVEADELKRTMTVSALQDTSGKIQSLISKFDDIDQETVMNMVAVYERETGNEVFDENIILTESKAGVLDLISQMKDLTDSEKILIDTLKMWFAQMNNKTDLNVELTDVPNVDHVIKDLERIVSDVNEKSEKVVLIHNDISDFMFKQIGALKRIITIKNEDISKLKKTIDEQNAAAEKRKIKKKQEADAKKEAARVKEQFEAQIKQMTELKNQVDQLKKQLQDSELKRIAAQTNQQPERSNSREMLEMNNNLANLKLVQEEMESMYNKKLEELKAVIAQRDDKIKDQDKQMNGVLEKLKKKEQEIFDLNAALQKQLKINAIESHRPQQAPPEVKGISQKQYEEEKALMILQHGEEIKKLQQEFSEEMRRQLDDQRERYMSERRALLATVTTGDQQALLASIQAEFQKRIDDLNQEKEEMKQTAMNNLASKLALITRQYEHRIKGLQENHQDEMNIALESLKHDRQILELDFEEKFNVEVRKVEAEANEKVEKLQKRIQELENAHNNDLEVIKNINSNIDEFCQKSGVDRQIFKTNLETSDAEKTEIAVPNIANQSLEISKYAEKLKIAREEMENQNKWELEKQKKFYDREMTKLASNVQQGVRDKLVELQDLINRTGNKETIENVMKMIESTTNMFETMNEQLIKMEDVQNEPVITINEVSEKTKSLTEKIIELRQKMSDMELEQGNGAKTIDDMKRELEMFRSSANGDQTKLKQLIDEMNEKHLLEIQERDKMIKDLSELGNTAKKQINFSMSGNEGIFNNRQKLSVDIGTTATINNQLKFTEDEVLLHVENVVVKDEKGEEKEVPIPSGILPKKEEPKREIHLSVQQKVQFLNIINEKAAQIQRFDNIVIQNQQQQEPFVKTPSRKRAKTIKVKSEPNIKPKQPKRPSSPLVNKEEPKLAKTQIIKPIEIAEEEKPKELPKEIIEEEKPKEETVVEEPPKVNEVVEEETKKVEEEEEKKKEEKQVQEEPKEEIQEEEEEMNEYEEEFIEYFDIYTQTVDPITHKLNLLVSEPLSKEEAESITNLTIPSGHDSFHISPRQEELRIVMTFVGEKYLAKKFDLTENTEIFDHQVPLQEPKDEVHLGISIVNHYCRLEPIVSFVVKDHDEGFVRKLEFHHMDIISAEIGYERKKGLEMDIHSFEVPLGQTPNHGFLDSIKVTAFDRQKGLYSKLKKDLSEAQKQLAEKPIVVLVKDHTLDEIAKPKFSRSAGIPLRAYTNENLGIPTLSKDLINGSSYLTLTSDMSSAELRNDAEEEEVYEEDYEEQTNENQNDPAPSGRIKKIKSSRSKLEMKKMNIQDVNLPDIDINADPFGSGIKLLQTQMRELKIFGDDDNECVEKIGSDSMAYYAYIAAAGYTDDAHFSFLDSIKAAKNEHDDLHTKLIRIIGIGQTLVKCVSTMKQRYERTLNDLNSTKVQAVKSEVKFQQELVNSIQQQADDPNASSKMNQLNHLHKLENSLSVVDSLKLVKTEEEVQRYDILMATVSQSIKQVKEDVVIPKQQMDKITNDIQVFIAELNKNELEQISQAEETSSEAKRLRVQRDNLRKELKSKQLETETLQTEVNKLQQRIEELKEQKNAEASLTQAQLSNLREAMAAGEGATPDQAKDQFKKHMLNMVSLLDAVNAEKSMLTSKVNDLEDELSRAYEREKKLQIQVSDLIDDNNNFKRSNTSSIMFKDADIEHLKEQLNADKIVNESQRKQLEEATANNAVLLQANSRLEDDLFNARSEIRQLKMQLEELNIQLTLKSKQNANQPLQKDNNSQKSVSLKLQNHSKQNSLKDYQNQLQRQSIVKNDNQKQLPPTPKEQKQNVEEEKQEIVEEKKEEEEKHEEQITQPVKEETNEHIQLTETKHEEDEMEEPKQADSSYNSKENLFRNSSTYGDEIDTFEESLVLIDFQKDNFSTLGDNAPHSVHNPLNFLGNKKKKLILTERPQTQTNRQRMRHTTSTTPSLPTNTDVDLTINNAVQGKRQISGVSEKVRPTTRIQDTTAVVLATTNNKPEGDLPVITSNLKFPQMNIEPPTNNRPKTSMGNSTSRSQQMKAPIPPLPGIVIDKTLEQNPPEPVRITLMVNNSMTNELKAIKKPMVIPPLPPPIQGNTSARSENLSLRGMQIAQKIEQRQNLETMRLIERLREQIKKLVQQNETSEKTIMTQRQKITELTLQLHRTKLDVIKANDTTKRTQIRADNIKSRIEICYNEISQRDDEIRKLKRELIILKNSTSPINEASSKIMIAKRERERIKRERRQRQEMKAATQEALKAATNEATYKHLSTLLANTESSMARLEANKRMWKEIERNQVMLVLEAMSRLSTTQVDRVKAMLPELSPFRSIRHEYKFDVVQNNSDEIEKISPKVQFRENPESIGPTYADKVMIMDKLDPPLTNEERRDIIMRRESPELTKRLVDTLKKQEKDNTITSQEVIKTA